MEEKEENRIITSKETNGDKKLITATKGTAYNKTFGVGVGNVPAIGEELDNSKIVETNAEGKLKTATKNDAIR